MRVWLLVCLRACVCLRGRAAVSTKVGSVFRTAKFLGASLQRRASANAGAIRLFAICSRPCNLRGFSFALPFWILIRRAAAFVFGVRIAFCSSAAQFLQRIFACRLFASCRFVAVRVRAMCFCRILAIHHRVGYSLHMDSAFGHAQYERGGLHQNRSRFLHMKTATFFIRLVAISGND